MKRKLDALHGQHDLSSIENAVQALDTQSKISENFIDEFQIKHPGNRPSHSYDYIGDESKEKIKKVFESVKPFSRKRGKVGFVNPVKSSVFSDLKDTDISKFLERNKKNFKKGTIDIYEEDSSDSEDIENIEIV